MMGDLLRRGEELARAAQAEATNEIAERLTRLLKGVTITTEEMLVIASGKGVLKRWLIDPRLRFLAGGRR